MRTSIRARMTGGVIAGLMAGHTGGALGQSATRQRPGQEPSQEASFASLMTDRVEVRQRPGFDQPVAVVFRRAGMPVRILEQAKGWRRIEDRDGASGWVPAELVSGRRTAVVIVPQGAAANASVAVRASDRPGGEPVALLEPGVVVGVVTCDGRTCRISTSGVRGYVDQTQIWGVGESEIVR